MDWSSFRVHGPDRGHRFYRTALEYGHYLWLRGRAARAILCLDRALGADLDGNESALAEWPLPYRAMAWFLAHAPADVFIGNPRVHFQHLADRMGEPRRAQRSTRAWACWVITRAVLPHLPGDPKHGVVEPTEADVSEALDAHGIPGEVELWRDTVNAALEEARGRGTTTNEHE